MRTEGLVYAQRLWFSDQSYFNGGQGFKDDNSAYRSCFIHRINFNSDFLHCRKGLLIYFCPFFERPEIFSCGCKKIKLAKVLDQTWFFISVHFLSHERLLELAKHAFVDQQRSKRQLIFVLQPLD